MFFRRPTLRKHRSISRDNLAMSGPGAPVSWVSRWLSVLENGAGGWTNPALVGVKTRVPCADLVPGSGAIPGAGGLSSASI